MQPNPYLIYEIMMNDPETREQIEREIEKKRVDKEYFKSHKPKGIIEHLKYLWCQI